MINEIIKGKSLANDWEIKNIPIYLEKIQTGIKRFIAENIEFHWCDITGIADGVLEIFVSNSIEHSSLICTINIDTINNSVNTEICLIEPKLLYLDIKYTKSNITGGTINGKINYL
jgi:hypothetical protein